LYIHIWTLVSYNIDMTQQDFFNNMSLEEKEQFIKGCKTPNELAYMYGYTHQAILHIIRSRNIKAYILSSTSHRNGKPKKLYHYKDIEPYVTSGLGERLMNLLVQQHRGIVQQLKMNPMLKDKLKTILREAEND
jgi:hypothetical protein